MKRVGTRKRGKLKKGKGRIEDAEKELAKINQLLKARAQKNDEFYSDYKKNEILRQAQLEKEKFGKTRPAELLKNREKNLLQQLRNNPDALALNLKKEMANLRRAKTIAIRAKPLDEQSNSAKESTKKPTKKPAKKPAKKSAKKPAKKPKK